MLRHPRIVLAVLLVLALAILGAGSLVAQEVRRPIVASVDVRTAAANAEGLRVVVSLIERRLRVIDETGDTLLSAPVATGSGRSLSGAGNRWTFATPRGVRAVVSKEVEPVWIRPDWSYVEAARAHHLRIDSVTSRRPRSLADGRVLSVRGSVVGLLDGAGMFESLPTDEEIAFGGVLYIPPIGADQRAVAGVLGHYRLNLGDGIGIHGTTERASIGRAVTHGCLRLADDTLEWVFENVPIGTRVFIY